MTVEAQTPPAALDGLSEDRERAQKVATGRRRRRQLQEIGIRLVSLNRGAGLVAVTSAPVSIRSCSRRRGRSPTPPSS